MKYIIRSTFNAALDVGEFFAPDSVREGETWTIEAESEYALRQKIATCKSGVVFDHVSADPKFPDKMCAWVDENLVE